jgi:endonuclease/exonuclease/phosphatase family metal-dependent hydrolase
MLFFLILNFLNAFAFTYPYILPAMKGMGWVVYLVAGISVVFLLPGRKSTPVDGALVFDGLGVVPLVVAVLLALISVWPVKAEDLSNGRTLRFATYNIHYGYDDAWRYTLEEIAEAIEEIGCDFVALQEVDTGRLTSYGVDNALYLARRLKMNVAYLPTIEHLTGIAVLYRGSTAVENSSLISSLEEQTGIVQVSIEGKRGELHAFGIWIGLSKEDTETQIAEAIEFIGDQSPALFGGDFNADPESDVAAAIRLAGFSDPFETLAIDPAPNTSPAIDPDNRIDFVWLRGFEPVEAWVPDSLASDHRIVVVEVELPE